jgi:hypothetical protein
MKQRISTDNFDIERLRIRLRKMTDKQLFEFGKNVRYLRTAEANLGQPPSALWLTRLWEESAEWKRRRQQTMENLP